MSPLSVLKISVDTATGDDSLVLASLESELHRPADIVVGCGGRTFIAILPDTAEKGALLIAERMRARVESLGTHDAPVSVTIGVASAVPESSEPAEAFLAAADGALSIARAAGGNCVATTGAGLR